MKEILNDSSENPLVNHKAPSLDDSLEVNNCEEWKKPELFDDTNENELINAEVHNEISISDDIS